MKQSTKTLTYGLFTGLLAYTTKQLFNEGSPLLGLVAGSATILAGIQTSEELSKLADENASIEDKL